MKKLLIILLLPVSIWAQATDTLYLQNTTDVEDTYLSTAGPDYNYGAAIAGGGLALDSVPNYYTHVLIRVKNLSDSLPANAVIDSCGCNLYITSLGGDPIYAYRLLKPWVEGTQTEGTSPPGATWNDWDNDDYEWGTAGAQNASDDGTDNSGDGSDYDRWATASGTIATTTDDAYNNLVLPDSLCQKWYDGTYNENGVFLVTDVSGDGFANSSEAASNQPQWYFVYHTATAGEKTWPFGKH